MKGTCGGAGTGAGDAQAVSCELCPTPVGGILLGIPVLFCWESLGIPVLFCWELLRIPLLPAGNHWESLPFSVGNYWEAVGDWSMALTSMHSHAHCSQILG